MSKNIAMASLSYDPATDREIYPAISNTKETGITGGDSNESSSK
jgi:hypothetical protein